MPKLFFSKEELMHLPLNCQQYIWPKVPAGQSEMEKTKKRRLMASTFHQNPKMTLSSNFYKAVSRRIELSNE